MADRQSIEHMVAAGVDALGDLDVLVNNTGIWARPRPSRRWIPTRDRVMLVDLTGTFNVTRLAIPHLKKSRAGVIINMSPVAGRFGYANRSPYCTAKWGLIGFTKTLSIELGGHGIRVNAILPGAVDGPRIQWVFDGRGGERSAGGGDQGKGPGESLKKLVDPCDITALAVFLASDAAGRPRATVAADRQRNAAGVLNGASAPMPSGV